MALNFPTGSATGQIYSAGGNSWIWTGYAWNSYSPTGIYLDDLQDVNTSGVASGQALIYNGSYWTNGSAGSAGGGFVSTGAAPSTGSLTQGYRWFDTETAIEFTLLDDGDSMQWVELPSVSSVGSSSAASGAVGVGVSDGDKGDIVVSATGTIWTIDTGVVNISKLGGDITTAGKNLLDDVDASAQRTTLGLGTAAVANTGDFAAASHTHNISGIVASGTPNYSTFLRGDSYWTTPPITDSINIAINSTPEVISTGSKGFKAIPYNCEVTDWFIFSSATGSIEFDIKRSSYSNYPLTASIIGSTGEKPVLSSSVKNKYETLTSWSGLSQGDVIEFWVTSCSGLQDVSLCMKTRTN